MHKARLIVVLATLELFLFRTLVYAENSPALETFDLSLQELLEIEVTSVSKQAEPLSRAAAAIYVITSDDIRRSGASSIPQALRDVPGLHVAQIDSQKWAVSSRGFNGRYNNKMLVMIDGRTLYSPEFSGVYWEVQDTLMADIERIEVIRGPSAAMWGANAVNGVINIITKHSSETLGGYAELGLGDYQKGFAGFRYGSRLTDSITARAYAKGFRRDELDFDSQDVDLQEAQIIADTDTDNAWGHQQVGGRLDFNLSPGASLRLSSAVYQSQMDQVLNISTLTSPYRQYLHDGFDSRGWHLMADYHQALSAQSEITVTGYLDHAKREEALLGFSRDTVDLEFSHQLGIGLRHDVLWGLAYRYIRDDYNTDMTIMPGSDKESINLWSGFIQDQIALDPDALWLTLAMRLEHHSYTGLEWQPTLRLMWQPDDHHRVWTALSRAVRTPSQLEHNATINALTLSPTDPSNPFATTAQLNLLGNEDYDSETVTSLELGYRYASNSRFTIDATAFFNDYDDLRSNSEARLDFSNLPALLVAWSEFDNQAEGENYGVEISANWLVSDSLKMRLNYANIESDFESGQSQNTDAPQQIVSLTADWSVNDKLNLNTTWRYVDKNSLIDPVEINTTSIDSYHGVDIGLNWQLTPKVQVSAFARNLFYGSHVEYTAELFSIPYRVEPSYFGKVTVEF